MKIIITHQNADFDGLSSMLAVRILWPDHQMVLSGSVSPPVQKYLALHRDWLTPLSLSEVEAEEVKEVVVVDSRDRRRFQAYQSILERAEKITVIDHHPPGDQDLEATEVIVEPVGACVTILCERLEEQKKKLSVREATLLMLGLYADTGNLSFSSTTVRDLRAAVYLRQNDGALSIVNRYLQQEYSPAQQQLLVALLGLIESVDRQGLRLGWAAYETPRYVKGAAQVVERVIQLLGLDAFFAVLQEQSKETVQIIGRSQTRHVDAAAVLSQWEGGGHPSAAAARARETTKEEVAQLLKQELRSWEVAPLEVRDVMSSPVQCVSHDMALEKLKPLLEKWGVSGVPVVREKRLAGVVSQRDVEKAVRREDWNVPVSGFMTHKVVTASPEQSLVEALEVMTEADVGRLPVLSGEEIVGIVSRSDVLRRLYDAGNDLASM